MSLHPDIAAVRKSQPVLHGTTGPDCPGCRKPMTARAGNVKTRCWWACECGGEVVTEAGKVASDE